jgi:hypothetical protein
VTIPLPALLKSQSRRTTFLSEGVKLCGLICAISAAPLPFVHGFVAIWLLVILSVVGLGTFGIWAFNAIRNRSLLDSEEHTEQMAAIAIMGQNREGKPPLLQPIEQVALSQNPSIDSNDQEASNG